MRVREVEWEGQQVERRRQCAKRLGAHHQLDEQQREVDLLRLRDVVHGARQHGNQHVQQQHSHQDQVNREQHDAKVRLLGERDAFKIALGVDGKLEQLQ